MGLTKAQYRYKKEKEAEARIAKEFEHLRGQVSDLFGRVKAKEEGMSEKMTRGQFLERIPAISVNPDMATREDIAMLAAELMSMRHVLYLVCEKCNDALTPFAPKDTL